MTRIGKLAVTSVPVQSLGPDLIERMKEQARKYGASIATARVTRLARIEGGARTRAASLLASSLSQPLRLRRR